MAGSMTDDTRLLAARDASRAGDRVKFDRISAGLQAHELEMYLQYWDLMLDLEQTSPDAVKAFLIRNEGSYLAEKLRGDWLKQLGKRGDWERFDSEFPQLLQPDQEVSFYALQTRHLRSDAGMEQHHCFQLPGVDLHSFPA